MTDLEKLKEHVNARDGYMHFNGMWVEDLSEGECVCRAEMGPDKANPHGMAHGGFLFAICDTAAGVAASTLGRSVVSRSSDFHFLRPGKGSGFMAKGHVVHAGRTMALSAVELYDDQQQLIATGSFEMYFLGPAQLD